MFFISSTLSVRFHNERQPANGFAIWKNKGWRDLQTLWLFFTVVMFFLLVFVVDIILLYPFFVVSLLGLVLAFFVLFLFSLIYSSVASKRNKEINTA